MLKRFKIEMKTKPIDLTSLTLIKLLDDKGIGFLKKAGFPADDLWTVHCHRAHELKNIYWYIDLAEDGLKYALTVHRNPFQMYVKGFNTIREFKTACGLLTDRIYKKKEGQ